MKAHYQRPMGRWYLRPFYLFVYTLRELTAVFVLLYALILLSGLAALAAGPEAWASYRQALAHPLSIGLHGLILVAALYNSITWFMVAPKAMPALFIGTRPLPGLLITLAHIVVFVIVSVALLVLAGAG
ncbi:MAG: fumarate reductase subunit C [Wenzhouxiangella sp.]|nr:fumarate reductase subunit C [Wenzhouxiangella sp.]TVR94409.1 MAG: fumarate reductase subunit C [Wenzhouxiangellaceae bacterium]